MRINDYLFSRNKIEKKRYCDYHPLKVGIITIYQSFEGHKDI